MSAVYYAVRIRCAARLLSLLLSILLAGSTYSLAQDAESGLHDLVILDPGKHGQGLPAVELKQKKDGEGAVTGLTVDIPPKVHVHRNYYSGDKTYQGPIVRGGPTIVVARHPTTGEQMYVDVVLPAGAPQIAYSKHGITYIYSKQRVEVKFRRHGLNKNVAVVKHHHGKGLRRIVHDSSKHIGAHIKQGLSNSKLLHSAKELTRETKDLASGISVSVGELSSTGSDGLKSLANLIPGVTYLKSLSEQKTSLDYQSKVRDAAAKAEADLPGLVPTIR